MKTTKKIIPSACDGLPLSVLECIPDDVKGIVQIAHGMSEHKERYLPFMEFLCQHGYACIIHDHLVHGKSVYDRKDLGYFYDDSAKFIVEDVQTVSQDLRKQVPDVPFILFGHSMGSLVVRVYMQKYDDTIDRLIVCGPPAKNAIISIAIALVNILEKLYGSHHRSALIEKLSTGAYNKGISLNAWLSKNPDNVEIYNADPDCGFRFTLNGYKNLFKLLKQTYCPANWNKKNLNLPILFIAGSEDPVIVSAKSFEQARDFISIQGYKNVSSHLFPGLRHEILNEKNNQEIYDFILNFIQK